MFKPGGLWRSSDKNKVKVVFKLQFRATQLPQVGSETLMVSLVPADTGKPNIRSDKAPVRDGSCFWENPVFETVKFNREPKLGKIQERIYTFVVGTGSSRAGNVGEASFDFSSYAESTKVLLVSLPLKNSKTEAVLHVSVQRIHESSDQREVEENENAKENSNDRSLRTQLSNSDIDETIKSCSIEDVPLNKAVARNAELNGNRRASSGSDLTLSSSESISGVEIPWEPQTKNGNIQHQGPKADVPTAIYEGNQRSHWEWLGNSALEASTDDSSSTPRETILMHHSEEAPDIVIEKLKTDVAALSRQTEMSELELQTLRKQIVKESKRGQDLFKEVVCLKEERDSLKGECEKLKASRRYTDAKFKANLLFEGGDSQAMVEELRQELNHAKELNANLQIQLQKMQESNSELILAVQDLDELLEQKNRETLNISSESSTKDKDENLRETGSTHQPYDDNDDEEQKALEELVKDHSDAKEAYLLEQQIMDLRSEVEIFKRDRDELEMQMEQLALDYEIMKQEHHDMSYKLEQSELQEQLKLQYECSPSYNTIQEHESQMENLENELKKRSKESEESLVVIRELEAHVKSLEEELETQAQGFEADLEALTRSRVEQEQRAIRAEETLRKTRWQNANTAERLQDEFRRLSVQMTSTFEANEKLAAKALAEANELRFQKKHLEQMLQERLEENESVKDDYEARLNELTSQVKSMTKEIEQMHSEIEDRAVQLEHEKKHAEETQRLLSDEVLKRNEEIETYKAKNIILSEENGDKETLVCDLEKMGITIKKMELLLEQGNAEIIKLESSIMLLKSEAEESHKELNKFRSLVEEKEFIVGNLQSELASLQSHYGGLKHSLSEDELEKEKLRKQILQLKTELKKKEDALNSMEKKMKDAVKAASKTGKPLPRCSKEVANLRERIKVLEGQIKLKETALETSSNKFLEKEKDLHNKIEELEERLEMLNQSSALYLENEAKKVASTVKNRDSDCKFCDSTRISNEKLSSTRTDSISSTEDQDALINELALLKEKNTLMDGELKEMQERYSEISLKFAEVEGERQQLVMKVRYLKNAKKSS